MKQITLNQLKPFQHAAILELLPDQKKRRRLLELGMQPGTDICCAHLAPGNSPIIFWVKGSLIALRLDDCRQIHAEIHG